MPAAWIAPTTAPTTQQSIATTQPAQVGHWWTIFNDSTLNSLITRAVESNIGLEQATERIRQARASRIVSNAALWPSVDTSASYRKSGSNDTERSLYQAGLDASWEIDIFGGNRRAVEAADADIRFAIEDRRDVLITLASEVAINYIQLRSGQREIEISRRNLAAQEHSGDLTRQLFNAGFVSQLDTANAEASVASTAAQIPSQEASVRQSIYALSVLLGQQPAALLQELSTAAPVPSTPPQVPVGLPSDLLRRRPDIRRAEARLHADVASIGVAESDLFPRFSLTGSLSSQSGKVGRLANWSNVTWGIGPSMSWPLFDAGRIRANIQIQRSFARDSFLSYQQAVLTALQDVENALIAYEKEQLRRDQLVLSVDANRRAVDLSTQLYTAGRTDFINVLNAQRSLYASENALSASDQTIATNLIALYKALGGGWEESEQVEK